jgi:hypothetical protein
VIVANPTMHLDVAIPAAEAGVISCSKSQFILERLDILQKAAEKSGSKIRWLPVR